MINWHDVKKHNGLLIDAFADHVVDVADEAREGVACIVQGALAVQAYADSNAMRTSTVLGVNKPPPLAQTSQIEGGQQSDLLREHDNTGLLSDCDSAASSNRTCYVCKSIH